MQQIWDTMILLVPQFLVDGTPKKNVQPCQPSNLNLRKDNRSKISGITTHLQIIYSIQSSGPMILKVVQLFVSILNYI
jgi:hypothetical protein